MATYDEFSALDIRVGTIIEVIDFPEARRPAYKLKIDFGSEIGIKQSSAQITTHYSAQELVNMQVLAVVNFAPKQIGPFMSEVLTLGVPDDLSSGVVLIRPTKAVPNGGRLY